MEAQKSDDPRTHCLSNDLFKKWDEAYLSHLSKIIDFFGQNRETVNGVAWSQGFQKYFEDVLGAAEKHVEETKMDEEVDRIVLGDLANKLLWMLKTDVLKNTMRFKMHCPLLGIGFIRDISKKFLNHELALAEVSVAINGNDR